MKNKFKRLLALGIASAQLTGLMSTGAFAENVPEDETAVFWDGNEWDNDISVSAYSAEETYVPAPFNFKAESTKAVHVEAIPVKITRDGSSSTSNAYWIYPLQERENHEGGYKDSIEYTLTVTNTTDNDVTYKSSLTVKSVAVENTLPPLTMETDGTAYEAGKFAESNSEITLASGESKDYKFTLDLTQAVKNEQFIVTLNAECSDGTAEEYIVTLDYTDDLYTVEFADDLERGGNDNYVYRKSKNESDYHTRYQYFLYNKFNGNEKPFIRISGEDAANTKEFTVGYESGYGENLIQTVLTGAVDTTAKKFVISKYDDLRTVKFTAPEGYTINRVQIFEDYKGRYDDLMDYFFYNRGSDESVLNLQLSDSRTYHYMVELNSENDETSEYLLRGTINSGVNDIVLKAPDMELKDIYINTPYVPKGISASYNTNNDGFLSGEQYHYGYYNNKYDGTSFDSANNIITAPALVSDSVNISLYYPDGNNIYYWYREFNEEPSAFNYGVNFTGEIDFYNKEVKSSRGLSVNVLNIVDELNNPVSSISNTGGKYKVIVTLKNTATGKTYDLTQGCYSLNYATIGIPSYVETGDYTISMRVLNDAYQSVTVTGDCKVTSEDGKFNVPVGGETSAPKGNLIIKPAEKPGYDITVKVNGKETDSYTAELGDEPLKIEVIHTPNIAVEIGDNVKKVTNAKGEEIKNSSKVGGDDVLTVEFDEIEGKVASLYVNDKAIGGSSFMVGDCAALKIYVAYEDIPEDKGALKVTSDSLNFELYEGYSESIEKDLIINNIGKGVLTSISAADSENLLLIEPAEIDSLESGAEAKIKVAPKTELEAGDYSGVIKIDCENSVTTATDVPFTIKIKAAGTQDAPQAPALEKAGRNSITLKAISNNANGAKAQYRMDGGEWQDSNVFSGLSADTSYEFEVRYASIEGFKESDPSAKAVYSTTKSSGNNNNNGGNYRPSYGGGGSSSTTPNIIPDSSPTDSSGNKTSWNDVSSQISEGKDVGMVTLGENPVVPASVIKTIADNKKTVTFKVDDTYSWILDGGNISGMVSSASFKVEKADIIQATVNQTAGLANITENNVKTFKLDGVSFGLKPQLRVSLGAANNNKFANLYKRNDKGDLEFVGTAKIAPDGTAEVPVKDNGSYVIAVDSESKLPGDFSNDGKLDVFDVSKLLKEVASGNITTALFKSDVNGDGVVNALDALEILRSIINS